MKRTVSSVRLSGYLSSSYRSLIHYASVENSLNRSSNLEDRFSKGDNVNKLLVIIGGYHL